MEATVVKGRTQTTYPCDHETSTFYDDRTIVELSGVPQDNRKVILTFTLPGDADEIYIMQGGRNIGKRVPPKSAAGSASEMRHAHSSVTGG